MRGRAGRCHSEALRPPRQSRHQNVVGNAIELTLLLHGGDSAPLGAGPHGSASDKRRVALHGGQHRARIGEQDVELATMRRMRHFLSLGHPFFHQRAPADEQ